MTVRRHRDLIFGWSMRKLLPAMAMVLAVAVAVTQPAQAQTFTVLHNFTGGADGAFPYVSARRSDRRLQRQRLRHGLQIDAEGLGVDLQPFGTLV